MKLVRLITLLLVAGLLPALSTGPASAGFLQKRYGSGYVVTPEMMHAIDVIVAEKMKMAHRRHR